MKNFLLNRNYTYLWRRGVQLLFALITVYIGIQFIRFVNAYADPNATQLVARPAGVDAFLPISALVAVKSWLANGIFDRIHPAGLVIFLAAMSLSLVFKRAFCSWICPFGTLSEGLALLGQKWFKRNFTPPKWLDYLLRSLKYLLLGLFIVFIFVLMDGKAAYSFLQTPYNMIADVKMLEFFKGITWVGITVILVLILLSVLIQNFWCRYLCPYGALLGILSLLSPWKIRRNETSCISCGRCTVACPNRLKVDKVLVVGSPECSGCLNCVEQCPVRDTLTFDLPKSSVAMSQRTLAIGVVVFWIAFIGIAKITGYWESSIAPEMYKMLIPMADKL